MVVEHDPDVMAIADHLVDMGPRAGTHGGEVVFEVSYEALTQSGTLTGQFVTQHLPTKEAVRRPTGQMTIVKANLHKLKNITVSIPTRVLTVVTALAGSGKRTLITDLLLAQHAEPIVIDYVRGTARCR